jgi:GH18 family chitinase
VTTGAGGAPGTSGPTTGTGVGPGGASSTASGAGGRATSGGPTTGTTSATGTTGAGGAIRDGGGAGGGPKDAGSGGSGGRPPVGDASRPFSGRSVVYLPSYRGSLTIWANGGIPWPIVTHVNIAFGVASGNTFTIQGNSDATLTDLVNAAHPNGVRVLLAIGGANASSSAVAALYTPGNVDSYVNNLANYVNALNLDGIDVDVEGDPVNADYGPFIDKLVAKLRPSGKLVTAALGQWFGDRVPASAYAQFDYINVMSYDHCGDWTPPCEHASMTWAHSDLDYFRGKGVPANKLVLGVPFYGYCWGGPTVCPATSVTYADIITKWPGAPDYYQNGGMTLSYNTLATIVAKTQLSKSYGGIMVWEIGQDAKGAQSLMTAIGNNL